MLRMRPAGLASLAIALAALLIPSAPASAQRAGRPAAHADAAALPAIARSPLARAVRRGDRRIEKNRQHYLARAGRTAPSKKKAREEARLEADARALGAAIRAAGDPRPILVILEGPDGAGKSGTIRRLRPAFEQVGAVREVHFGAPPAGETAHWLARYRAELPRSGEVVIWDRSYYGRVVYDPYYQQVTKSQVSERYGEIEALEAELASSVRIVKVYLDARGDRLAQTIGKREASAPEKLAESDYQTFRDRKQIRHLFERAIKKTGNASRWHVVPMKDRAAGRRALLDVLRRELL